MSSLSSPLRRARPLLGTLVDITLVEADAQRANDAFDAAFAAVAQVHALMSVHDPSSELSVLIRSPCMRVIGTPIASTPTGYHRSRYLWALQAC